MAAALAKIFKRHSVFCNDRPDAETAMALLPCWFEDYNKNAPHKALRTLSPREFIRSLQNLEFRLAGATPLRHFGAQPWKRVTEILFHRRNHRNVLFTVRLDSFYL